MERGNTKHGPAHDDEMAHETRALARGSAQRPHVAEWRETEPVEDSVPPPARQPQDRDIDHRSELARVMTKDVFPADREVLLGRLAGSDVPQGLADRVARLPPRQRFGSVHDVLAALGISSPETSG